MEKNGNAINWFEIPVVDFDRAKKFYETVLGQKITNHPMPDANTTYGVLPYVPGTSVGGAIMKMDGFEPSQQGPVLYLNGGDDLSDALSRVEGAGGKITIPKTDIGENGFMAHFIDTEGNRIALHSMN